MPFCHFEFDNAIPTFGQKVKLGHRICNSNPFGWKFSSIEDSKGDVFTSISFVFHLIIMCGQKQGTKMMPAAIRILNVYV